MNQISGLDLLLIRHGESQNNRDGSGGADSSLTDLGAAQSQRLARWLGANLKPTALYSSTMLRAKQTAEIIAPALKLPISFRSDLREANFDITQVYESFTAPAFAIGAAPRPIEKMPPPYVDFEKRVAGAFREIVSAHPLGLIAVVTHGIVIATLLRSIFGSHQVSVNADNTSLSLLRWHNARWYLVYANRREHLL